MESANNGHETYSTAAIRPVVPPVSFHATEPAKNTQPIAVQEEEDDPSIPVPVGTQCKRHGCGAKFESDETNRLGSGEGTVCIYHSAPVSQSKIR